MEGKSLSVQRPQRKMAGQGLLAVLPDEKFGDGPNFYLWSKTQPSASKIVR
jgi:hypothetical protein